MPSYETVTDIIELAMSIEAQAMDLYLRASEKAQNETGKKGPDSDCQRREDTLGEIGSTDGGDVDGFVNRLLSTLKRILVTAMYRKPTSFLKDSQALIWKGLRSCFEHKEIEDYSILGKGFPCRNNSFLSAGAMPPPHGHVGQSWRPLLQKAMGVTVIGPSDHHYYSGMGPGMLSGTYQPDEIRFATRHVVEKMGRDVRARQGDPH